MDPKRKIDDRVHDLNVRLNKAIQELKSNAPVNAPLDVHIRYHYAMLLMAEHNFDFVLECVDKLIADGKINEEEFEDVLDEVEENIDDYLQDSMQIFQFEDKK